MGEKGRRVKSNLLLPWGSFHTYFNSKLLRHKVLTSSLLYKLNGEKRHCLKTWATLLHQMSGGTQHTPLALRTAQLKCNISFWGDDRTKRPWMKVPLQTSQYSSFSTWPHLYKDLPLLHHLSFPPFIHALHAKTIQSQRIRKFQLSFSLRTYLPVAEGWRLWEEGRRVWHIGKRRHFDIHVSYCVNEWLCVTFKCLLQQHLRSLLCRYGTWNF